MVATSSAYQQAVDRAAAFGGPGALITFQSRDKLLYRVRSTSRPGHQHKRRNGRRCRP